MSLRFLTVLFVSLCLTARGETFSEGALNFEITGDNTCRLIASPGVSGTVTLPPALTYENIEYSLTAIAPGALVDARSLEALLVPGSVTEIGSGVARGCTGLRVLELSAGLETLGSEAFVGCSALESAVLPDGLGTIPRRCFYGASALREVRLGSATTAIETQAFDGCRALASVVCMAAVPPAVAPYAFDSDAVSGAMLIVPVGCRQAYASEPVWRDFHSIVESDNGGEQVDFTLILPSGRVVTREPLGSRVTLGVAAAPGWEIAGLYLDGTDVTADITSTGYYTTPALTAPATLSLTLREAAGVDDAAAASASVRRRADMIFVEGIAAEVPVIVWSLEGRLLWSGRGSGGIALGTSAPVILKAGDTTFKL